MMKVLTVSSAKWGIQNAVYSLLDASADTEFDHTHLTLPIHTTPDTARRVEFLRAWVLELLDSIRPLYLLYAIHFFWILAYRHISEHANRYDVIWLHSPMLLPLLPTKVEQKAVVTIHGPLTIARAQRHEFPASLYYRLLGGIQRTGIRSATGVTYTVVQADIADQLREEGVPEERIYVIGNGVDIDRFRPDVPPNRFGDIGTSEMTLLSVGRLIDLKRPMYLLKTFAEIQRQTESSIELILVGDGPLRGRAESFVVEHGLEASVTFLGIVDHENMPEVYATADMFVLSSEYEGEPLVLYEAMATGLPAAVADLPSCRFVSYENCGIVVDFDTPQEAASDIVAYLGEDQQDHSRNARAYVETNVTWEARADVYREVFKSVPSST